MRQHLFTLTVIALGLAFCFTVDAQDPNYRLTTTSGSGDVGQDVDIEFYMTNAEDITGYSWSVCHSSNVSIADDTDILPGSVVDDADTLFTSESAESDGFVVAVVMEIDPIAFISAGANQLMYTVTYDLDAEGTALLTYCDTVGDPSVPLTIADADGLEVIPVTLGGSIQVSGDSGYLFKTSIETVGYDPDDVDGETFTVTISIEENSENIGFPNDTQGFKLGVRHIAEDMSITSVDVDPGSDLEDLDDGNGPVFFGANLDPNQGDGFTLGCIYYFETEEFITFNIEKDVVQCTYTVVDELLDGNVGGAQTTLEFDETLSNPAVINAVVVDSIETDDVVGLGSLITFVNTTGTLFLRGDVDGDGVVSALIDAQFGLNHVFNGGDEPPCLDAMDVNDDSTVSALVDMLSLLFWQFGTGAPPAAPGTVTCGIDTSVDSITCLTPGDGC